MCIAALAAAALFTAASGHCAHVQPMPPELVGRWAPEESSRVVAKHGSGVEFPFFVVTRNGYVGHECRCRLTIGPGPKNPRGNDARDPICL